MLNNKVIERKSIFKVANYARGNNSAEVNDKKKKKILVQEPYLILERQVA